MNEMMSGMPMGGGPLMLLVFIALIVVPFWFIFKKTGYSPWLSLLMVVPLLNIVLLFFLAFSQWPASGGRS
jgi:hypothetical protein